MTVDAQATWKHKEAVVNGVRLHWVEQGSGPLVVLLHGFPEFWYSWRHQIPVLAERFHVVAPDMRGYNLSEKPATGYDLKTLTDDVLALVRAQGVDRAHIVGHDWGGVVAWAFAARHACATDKLAILNAPYPFGYREAARNPRQLLRSSYVFFFQVPRLPERLLGVNRCWLLARVMQRSAKEKSAFSEEDLEQYRAAMSRPGALRAALSYYRAIFRNRGSLEPDRQVRAPTLVLWGEHDTALGKELTYGLERSVPNVTVQYLDCGHWTQQERFGEVNRYLMGFLVDGEGSSPEPGTL